MTRADGQISMTIDHVCTDVRDCLAAIEVLIRRTWPSSIRLELHAASDLPAVRCDRLDLQTAIMSLVFNARDAMPNGGMISICVTRIPRADGKTQVEVRITDSGLGMTRETLERAFDPFFTTKAEGLGGLGLPMVQRFAHEAGGEIAIESRPGAGATVSLRLPASAREREPQVQHLRPLSPDVDAMPLQPLMAGVLPVD